MSYPLGLSDTRNRRKFFPPPSLHISLLRNDPWNEFVVHGPASDDDFLNFKSINDAREAEMRAKVYEQLTVVSGIGPELAPPPNPVSDLASVLPPVPVVELPSFPALPSFLFGSPEPDIPVIGDSSAEAVSKDVSETVQDPVGPADATTATSIWGRVQSAWANLRGVSDIGLPSWFSAEQGLVPPTDAAIRSALGSIYGGTRSTVIVTVRVIEAIDVPALDWTGSSDPYVSACIVRGVGGLSAGRLELLPTIGAIKSCTPKFSTLNPKWNESILLDPADLLSVISDSVLHISMWDKDILKADDPVGYTSMSLVDALQVSGVSPFPLLPVQITGSLIGPHAGIFVKIQLRMIKKVGCVSVTPIALQGFTRGWKGYSVRLDVKVTEADPIASQTYVSSGLSQSESTSPAEINDTGHALWPKSVPPVTVLFTASKKTKPYLHITLKTDSVSGDAGQVAVRIGLLEKLGGITAIKLSPLDGSPSEDKLNKCALYCGVECELGAD